jgi:formylglycine-generating enzyme required for sulfatase activity
VNYDYRIAKTEVTTGQWIEFVRAYAPHHTGAPFESSFTSLWVNYEGNGQYSVAPGAEQWPAAMSWRMAARYCNWLTNGKVNEAWAFESGAYDTSTFVPISPGSPFSADQLAHSPGAKFWIPTLDEWIKAAYYDPNKYGVGQEGYWRYPGASDVPLRTGLPEDGGQTSAGLGLATDLPVGLYFSVPGPWGLLDTSGGLIEWTETSLGPGFDQSTRVAVGSTSHSFSTFSDPFDVTVFGSGGISTRNGLRLASAIPSPTCLSAWIGIIILFRRR